MRDFNHTVSRLVTWSLKDELKHGDCAKCVVGNLCGGQSIWKYLFMTDEYGVQRAQRIQFFTAFNLGFNSSEELLSNAVALCESTGYSVEELARIEKTFELSGGVTVEERMFNGLIAVVDVLADIHKVDLSVKEEAKKLFVKA